MGRVWEGFGKDSGRIGEGNPEIAQLIFSAGVAFRPVGPPAAGRIWEGFGKGLGRKSTNRTIDFLGRGRLRGESGGVSVGWAPDGRKDSLIR